MGSQRTAEAKGRRRRLQSLERNHPQRVMRDDPGDPSVCNVFSYHGYFSDEATCQRIDGECRSAAIGCVDCKKLLAESMEAELGPVRERLCDSGRETVSVDRKRAAGRHLVGVGGGHDE